LLPYYGILKGKILLDIALTSGFPNQLNILLANNELDISPISSIEYARHMDEYLLLPNLCLNSEGPVKSVVLISKLRIEELNNSLIALPVTSATSQVLLKILLSHLNVSYQVMEPEINTMLLNAQAALLIGDDALCIQNKAGFFIYDLAELWYNMTGYPVIFAVWAVRRRYAEEYPHKVNEIIDALNQSLKYGITHIDNIVTELSLDFPNIDLSAYLRNLRYEFGDREREALCVYYNYAAELGLCNRCSELNFFNMND
jgi:chorismate dehydratase